MSIEPNEELIAKWDKAQEAMNEAVRASMEAGREHTPGAGVIPEWFYSMLKAGPKLIAIDPVNFATEEDWFKEF